MIYTQGAYSPRIEAVATPYNGLVFRDGNGGCAHISGLPEGVAEATAAAFNMAMKAAEDLARNTADVQEVSV